MQTAHGSIDAAINAMRAGAVDFVVKPASPERLEVSIKSALKIEALAGEITRIKKKVRRHAHLRRPHHPRPGHAARHRARPARRRLQHPGPDRGRIRRRQGADRARHPGRERARRPSPFVTVNCGAIPENLVESILFGHEKGSFTGAVDKRIGKFQEADGGTLFLDEIGELPLDAQVKLLRALQEGEIDPVGAQQPVKVDFRLISATNRDMIELVKDGRFREDLYYRLNVFPIWVPPLRDRLGGRAGARRSTSSRASPPRKASASAASAHDALRLLTRYAWPGNVRQLENAVFRAVVLCDGAELTVAEFPQIAAHVEGFRAGAAAAGTGPKRRPSPGRACSAPRTWSRRRSRCRGRHGDERARHPGRHRRAARSARSRRWRPT